MRVLFISSGNKGVVKPVVFNQGESLKQNGIDVVYYLIKGRGITGYIKNIIPLKRVLNDGNFDIIHAHYSFSAFLASIAGAKPLVVSLMGSDVKAGILMKWSILIFNYLFKWQRIIVKSDDMKISLNIQKAIVIPNGVNTSIFKPLDKNNCKKMLGWDPLKKNILFAANPFLKVKNFSLFQNAITLINDEQIIVHTLSNINPSLIPIIMNASDVIVLTSNYEGSPNVIKEAMACCCPIVTTNVGDVSINLKDLSGCYIVNADESDIKENILLSLRFNQLTSGLTRINELGLDSISISNRIINIYKEITDGRVR